MSERPGLSANFKDLILLSDILDQYRLAIVQSKEDADVSAPHVNLKKRIIKLMNKNDKNVHVILKGARREWVYFRNVIFQYFIGLLKMNMEKENMRYHELYKEIGVLINDDNDEIAKAIEMISDYKIGPGTAKI